MKLSLILCLFVYLCCVLQSKIPVGIKSGNYNKVKLEMCNVGFDVSSTFFFVLATRKTGHYQKCVSGQY